VTNWSA
jgi:Transposase DDE domain